MSRKETFKKMPRLSYPLTKGMLLFFLLILFADDHTRVLLNPIEGVAGSDYINANFIDVSFVFEPIILRWYPGVWQVRFGWKFLKIKRSGWSKNISDQDNLS